MTSDIFPCWFIIISHLHFLGCFLSAEVFRIEKSSPIHEFFVLLVLRVTDGIEIVGTASRPAQIFWWIQRSFKSGWFRVAHRINDAH